MKRIFSIICLTMALLACSHDEAGPETTDLTVSDKSAKIIAADNQFGIDLFSKVIASAEGPKNTMISPMSVSLALAMVYNGADGDTKVQMEQMLRKSGLTPDEINQSYKELVDALVSHDPKVELSISNAIFYLNDFAVKNSFIETNQQYYDAEVDGLDFTNTNATLTRVNDWVNTKTKGKIDKIINQVDPLDVMYLLNAIYFNGEWTYRFDKEKTLNQPFTCEDQTEVQTPMMNIENEFAYYQNDDFELLEMPYGDKKYSMLILLPVDGKSTNDLIGLLTADNIGEWLKKVSLQKKEVYLPRFKFRFENSLVDELEALGMTDAFDAMKANLTGISEEADLLITEVMHKSYIKVDERGTEAAAVTGITVGVTSVGPDNSFRADHPFLFLIREKDTNAILFIGKVADPSKE